MEDVEVEVEGEAEWGGLRRLMNGAKLAAAQIAGYEAMKP